MNVLSLFTGIGGLDLGMERAGMTVVGQVEIDPYCRRVLARHWPEVPRHDDVHTTPHWWTHRPRPGIDVVAGGFPCQPVSAAGTRRGERDPRWLWPAMAHVVAALGPEWVLFENVPGLRTHGLRTVLADLDRLGYRVRVGTLSACTLGAPHPRQRLFGLAHAPSHRRHPRRGPGPGPAPLEPRRRRPPPRRPWTDQPRPPGVAHGIPAGVDRRRALGNAVVPATAEHLAHLILTTATTATAATTTTTGDSIADRGRGARTRPAGKEVA